MIMGKATHESFGDDLPLGKALLAVMTHDTDLLAKNQDSLIFTELPDGAVELAYKVH